MEALVILAVVVLAIMAVRRSMEEPCCPRGEGCNESEYVWARRCYHGDALRHADDLVRPGLEVAWQRYRDTPHWRPIRRERGREYRALRDAVLLDPVALPQDVSYPAAMQRERNPEQERKPERV